MSEIQEANLQQIEAFYKQAVDDAARFDLKLRFKEEDVLLLEALLSKINDFIKTGEAPPTSANNLSLIYGVYLGETMLRNYGEANGYAWARENNEPILWKKEDNSRFFPVTKVYKRLTRDITENVKSFYDVGKQVANGTFDPANGASLQNDK